jgi:hypothetical protein
MPFKQLGRLLGRNIANRSETIHILRRSLLDGMLGHHVQLTGHLIAIVVLQLVVKGQSVPSNGASNSRCMSGENRCNLRDIFPDIECPHTQLPFIEMGNDMTCFKMVIPVETLNDHP